jgi:hypothetical protein
MWPKRKHIQTIRRLDDETLTERLSPVDAPPHGR